MAEVQEKDVKQKTAKNKTARLALLGAPNCGKTSLFNALTGGRAKVANYPGCLLYTSPSPRDATLSRMPSSA